MNPVIIIPTLSDNFSYLYIYEKTKTVAIDPSDHKPILDAAKKQDLNITHIITTHSHFDHNAGLKPLQKQTNAKTPPADTPPAEIQTIKTPGHTSDSVCYYIPQKNDTAPILFTGDTLFICGCGRPMLNPPETLYHSLKKLTDLPDHTLIYPGHDYTEENYRFAQTIDPQNQTLKKLLEEIRNNRPGANVPSTIKKEKQTNPFLRVNSPQSFTKLRKNKNSFG